MGLTDLQKRMATWVEMAKLLAVIGAGTTAALGAILATLWLAYGGVIMQTVRDVVGTTDVVARVERIERILTDEDGVIAAREGFAYAMSPVSKADNLVILHYSLRLTRQSQGCRAVSASIIFEGQRHIRRMGQMLTQVPEVGPEWTEIEVRASVPPEVALGRVVVWLALDYDCPEGRRQDKTPNVAFDLVE